MKSQSAAPLGVQVPRVRHAPTVRASAWEDVADLAKAYGLLLDPWQENVLQASMGERSDGQWATPRVGVSVPRQNGKGALIEARELAGLLLFGEETIVHSAHEQKTARVGFDRILSYFENYDDLRKRVKSVISALNRESITLTTGQQLIFPARSKGAIRGFSIDCLILDEGQILGDAAWQAIQFTISARPNPQTWLLGTPPTPLDDGAVFTRMRDAGLEGKDHRLCWCEWSAPDGSDLDSPESWAMANPALGIRITTDAVSDERASQDDEGFARERLGMWGSVTSQMVIDPVSWARAADMMSQIDDRLAIAADVTPDRTAGSVSVAGLRADGRWHVEMVDNRNGTGWIVDRVAGIAERQGLRAVVVDEFSNLAEPLTARGLTVTTTKARQLTGACAELFDATMQDRLRHLDQPQMNAALAGARKRMVGDGWAWNRKNASTDITPVVSCTLALWGAQSEAVAKVAKPSAVFAF
jgi:hypothetical protein